MINFAKKIKGPSFYHEFARNLQTSGQVLFQVRFLWQVILTLWLFYTTFIQKCEETKQEV